MFKILKKINTNINLLKALAKKLKALIKYLKQKKLLSFTLLVVLIVGGIVGYKKLKPQPIEKKYQLATVEKRDLKKIVNASGTIKSQTEADLRFQTSGRLAWVNVKKGDQVKKWQAIAGLDIRELQKTLEKYLRDYSKERNDFEEDRLETYDPDKGLITDTIKRILQKNQWDLDKAVLDVELKDIALKYAVILSPIDGIITRVDAPVGGINITPATAIFTVVDPEKIMFEAEVDEIDIGHIQASQPAELILDTYPEDTISVKVDSIDFASTVDSGGSTVFLVKFYLNNPNLNKYRLGMNGEINIIIDQRQNVLVVPTEAVEETETSTVKVVKNRQIFHQPVETGLVTDDYIEIISGLDPGDIVVVYQKSK